MGVLQSNKCCFFSHISLRIKYQHKCETYITRAPRFPLFTYFTLNTLYPFRNNLCAFGVSIVFVVCVRAPSFKARYKFYSLFEYFDTSSHFFSPLQCARYVIKFFTHIYTIPRDFPPSFPKLGQLGQYERSYADISIDIGQENWVKRSRIRYAFFVYMCVGGGIIQYIYSLRRKNFIFMFSACGYSRVYVKSREACRKNYTRYRGGNPRNPVWWYCLRFLPIKFIPSVCFRAIRHFSSSLGLRPYVIRICINEINYFSNAEKRIIVGGGGRGRFMRKVGYWNKGGRKVWERCF